MYTCVAWQSDCSDNCNGFSQGRSQHYPSLLAFSLNQMPQRYDIWLVNVRKIIPIVTGISTVSKIYQVMEPIQNVSENFTFERRPETLNNLKIININNIKSLCRNVNDWLSVHNSINLVDFQLDAQNSYLFIYNAFLKILYMFRALPCSSSGVYVVIVYM
jgi:hypothetical protein